MEKEALAGNGRGSGKRAWDEGGGRDTEAERSEAPPRRVRFRREKDGKEKATGVAASAAGGGWMGRRKKMTARRKRGGGLRRAMAVRRERVVDGGGGR